MYFSCIERTCRVTNGKQRTADHRTYFKECIDRTSAGRNSSIAIRFNISATNRCRAESFARIEKGIAASNTFRIYFCARYLYACLFQGCEVVQAIHAQLEALEQHYQLSTLQSLNFGLVEVVYDWAEAKSFAEIMKKTDVQEGIIVRCIQQLSETLRDVKNAAVTIGDPVLKEKMEEASTAIKRDIVFAASLYTQD